MFLQYDYPIIDKLFPSSGIPTLSPFQTKVPATTITEDQKVVQQMRQALLFWAQQDPATYNEIYSTVLVFLESRQEILQTLEEELAKGNLTSQLTIFLKIFEKMDSYSETNMFLEEILANFWTSYCMIYQQKKSIRSKELFPQVLQEMRSMDDFFIGC